MGILPMICFFFFFRDSEEKEETAITGGTPVGLMGETPMPRQTAPVQTNS